MKHWSVISYLVLGLFFICPGLAAQEKQMLYRIAKIKVNSNQLQAYRRALQEQMTTAVKVEPGVLSYTAMADKIDSTSITIVEIYADMKSYQSHLSTAHFKKYKETVKDMILSLELIDMELFGSARKKGF